MVHTNHGHTKELKKKERRRRRKFNSVMRKNYDYEMLPARLPLSRSTLWRPVNFEYDEMNYCIILTSSTRVVVVTVDNKNRHTSMYIHWTFSLSFFRPSFSIILTE